MMKDIKDVFRTCELFKMELFTKIARNIKLFTIFTKSFILNVSWVLKTSLDVNAGNQKSNSSL